MKNLSIFDFILFSFRFTFIDY